MFTSALKASSLLLLLASSAQCFTAGSQPSLVSFFNLPTINTNPALFLEGKVGDPTSVSLFHVTKDNCMRYRKATKNNYGQYTWDRRLNIGGPFKGLVPAVVKYKDTNVVFGVATTHDLKYAVYDAVLGDYKEWVSLAGNFNYPPQAVYLEKRNEIVITIRGGGTEVYYRIGTPESGFGKSYTGFGGRYTTEPRIAVFTDNSGQENAIVVLAGYDNYFHYRIYSAGTWAATVKTSLGASEGWESTNLYPHNYDSDNNCFRGVTLVARTKNGRVVYAKFDKSTGWSNFIDFAFEIPSKCEFGDLRNGTNVYSTSQDGNIYLSSFGKSICGNRYR